MPFGGTTTVDDFASGTVAAALGGTTTIVDFALHTQGRLARQRAQDVARARPAGKAAIDYAFHLTIADGRPETIEEIPQMIEREGVNSFKVFMAYKHVLQVDDETIFKVLKAAARFGGLVQVHAENGDVIEVTVKEALAAGHTAPKYHALTRPVELEARGDVARDPARRSRRARRCTSCTCRARWPPTRSATAASAGCRSTARRARSISSAT